MKMLIYPVREWVCANCGYFMFNEILDTNKKLNNYPKKIARIHCANEQCEFYNKKAIIEPMEVELESE